MNYLLDSNTVSDFYNSDAPCHDPILNRFVRLEEDDKVYQCGFDAGGDRECHGQHFD
jgi:hypothetical protein